LLPSSTSVFQTCAVCGALPAGAPGERAALVATICGAASECIAERSGARAAVGGAQTGRGLIVWSVRGPSRVHRPSVTAGSGARDGSCALEVRDSSFRGRAGGSDGSCTRRRAVARRGAQAGLETDPGARDARRPSQVRAEVTRPRIAAPADSRVPFGARVLFGHGRRTPSLPRSVSRSPGATAPPATTLDERLDPPVVREA
jgi:hypothetical protein